MSPCFACNTLPPCRTKSPDSSIGCSIGHVHIVIESQTDLGDFNALCLSCLQKFAKTDLREGEGDMWQQRGAAIVYPGGHQDPFRLSARRIRTEGRICGGCTNQPTALSSVHPAGLVCVCVCAEPLAGSIFVYWTTFCQLPIAHQLPPAVQRRLCRLSLLQGQTGEEEGKSAKSGSSFEQEAETGSESRHLCW